ncbi:MAG: hypothetical protein HY939_03565 [Gammaproteobacteria bacterium]|nr:hypothetical protein [Gammaproteobacteria bacterium]
MIRKKAKKSEKMKAAPAKVVNKDITETIRASYQAELKTQSNEVQSLKKALKSLSAQLSKSISKRRILKKKKIVSLKKLGLNPKGQAKKQADQIKAEYQAAIDEVKSTQQGMEKNRQETRLVKEQVKKITAIIRSIQKMEKRWDKAIAAKFRAKPAKKKAATTAIKKKKTANASNKGRGRPNKAKEEGVELQPLETDAMLPVEL